MLLVVTSNNLIVMWAAIEATTLSSAFLVGIYGQRSSLEAAWKYIIICTVGVAFGLFGTVLVYANAASVMPQAEMAIFWSEVLKQSSLLDPTLMLLAFVFLLIGFGTKTGLFPMHAWLPDAHSEAPSPVSALLSAVLLNCALLVLIRYYIIICQAIGSDFPTGCCSSSACCRLPWRHFSFWYSGTLSVCWRTPAWRTWGWSRWR